MVVNRKTFRSVLVLIAVLAGLGAGCRSGGNGGSAAGKSLAELFATERELGPGNPSSQRIRVVVDDSADPSIGPRAAGVTVVAFIDFESEESRRVGALLREAAARSPGKVRVVEKPFPPQATASPVSEAMLAAHAQGRYEAFSDRLARQEGAADTAALDRLAAEAGLDTGTFGDALERGRFRGQVKTSKTYGRRIGIASAPAVYVDGKRLDGEITAERLHASIDEDLALLAERPPAADAYTMWMKEAQPGKAASQPEAAATLDYGRTYDLPLRDDEPAMGKPKSEHTIVLFADLQCPYCAKMEPVLEQLMSEHRDQLRIVWKHFPLPIHDHAQLAHEASLAAHEQGRFWELAHLILEHQDHLDRASLERYAAEISLDMDKFREALDSGRLRAKVEEDMQLARDLGVNGTPTVFIDGRPVKGVQQEEIEDVLQGRAPGSSPRKAEPDPVVAGPATGTDASVPAVGPADAPASAVFFVDYESPACKRVWQTLQKTLAENPKGIHLAVKQRPTAIHARSEALARLAVAAQRQGKFWEMHEALLARTDYSVPVDPAALADELGLQKSALLADVDSEAVRTFVARQVADADGAGAWMSPSVIVNSRLVRGAGIEERVRAALTTPQ